MAIQFQGYVFQDDGDALNGATVQLLQVSDGAEEASTTSDSNGLWTFSEADDDRYDIKITSGSSVRYRKWADEMSVKAMDIRNNSANTEPALQVTNLTNNASNQVAVFSGANSTRADGDEIYLSFNLADDGGNQHEFARLTAEATDVSNGSEDGQFRFGVSVAGTMTDVFTIDSSTGGSTTMTLDVSGDLVLDADGGDILFKDGGTTFGSATNTSGNLIIKSGTTTALTFAGANVTAAGTIGSGAITSTGIVTGTGFTAGSAVLAEAELELLDGLTAGTAIASKVVTTDASIDTSGQRNLTITGALTAATIDLSSSADFAGDLVLSGGADGALQFTNAGENSIKIPDNQGSALIIEEANNAYITFDTQDGAEAITVAKATTFSAGIADSGTISAGTWNGTAIASAYLDSDTAHLSGTQTFTGAKTFTSTVTVGVDDTGQDVQFFGATTGQYLLWDESSDELVLAGDTKLSFHDAAGGENIIASADGHLEINSGTTLDLTAPTVDLNSSTEFNIDTAIYDLNASGAVTIDAAGLTTVTGTNNAVGTIYLRANAGTSETIKIHSDQGTSVTEGAESVTILSDAGGVGIRSTANLANAVNLTVDGGTTSTMTLFNDQGTSVTEGAASIQLLTDAGGIGIKSTANLANAILLTADGGTSETIVLHADQGTGASSIKLLSDAGGIEINAGTDIILDAGGADLLFKDGGTTIATLSNSSSDFVITTGVQDKDFIVKGDDGGSAVTAMTLDMSDAGAATLNNGLTLSDGNLVVASGHGVDFSAADDASGMTSELLDDYEEGTWTPVILSGGSAMSGQNLSSTATYVKVGSVCHVQFDTTCTAIGTGNSSAYLSGLPFTAASSAGRAQLFIGFFDGLNKSVVRLGGDVNGGGVFADLYDVASAADSVVRAGATDLFQNSARFMGSCTYTTT